MTVDDLKLISPFIVLTTVSVIVILTIAWRRNHRLTAVLTLAGFGTAVALLPAVSGLAPREMTSLIRMDTFSLFMTGILCLAGFSVAVLAYSYFRQQAGHNEEFYVLLLLSTLGTCVLTASIHFASFFLSLEILSVSLYALTSYLRHRERSIEAGVKYLILAAVSSAFVLFGMALVYAETGSMEFSVFAGPAPPALLVTAGLILIVSGLGFKLAVVPFHLWTPDVYEGAPAPVTAFIATVSKVGVFALVLRLLVGVDFDAYRGLFAAVWVMSVASMFTGNFLALLQTNIKRIFAYSSISHLGYLLVTLLAAGPLRITAALFYLAAYTATMIGAFGVVTLLSGKERDADALEDYVGLAWRRPWLVTAFTAMLLSLAGIPLTAGFIGKFYVAAAGVESALWLLVVILVVNSAIGLYYYLRIVVVLYSGGTEIRPEILPLSGPGMAVVLGLLAALLWLGTYPAPVLSIIDNAARTMR